MNLFGLVKMTSLQDQLDEITANTRKLVQAERLAVGERAVEELFGTGIEERILPVRAMAEAPHPGPSALQALCLSLALLQIGVPHPFAAFAARVGYRQSPR